MRMLGHHPDQEAKVAGYGTVYYNMIIKTSHCGPDFWLPSVAILPQCTESDVI